MCVAHLYKRHSANLKKITKRKWLSTSEIVIVALLTQKLGNHDSQPFAPVTNLIHNISAFKVPYKSPAPNSVI